MANTLQQFVTGMQGMQNVKAQQQQMQQREQLFPTKLSQQQAELQRFMDDANLRSMAQGALQAKSITDPVQQDAFLRKRVDEIVARGGDPRDTLEVLKTPYKDRGAMFDNVINIAERSGLIQGQAPVQERKLGKIVEGVSPEGKPVFAEITPGGERVLKSVAPADSLKTQAGEGAGITSKLARDMETKIADNTMQLGALDEIGKQYKESYLTYGGRIKGKISALKSKAGFELSPEGKKFLQERTKFIQGVNGVFNQYRKSITGAAASMLELNSLKKAMMNEDQSPAEFEASYNQFRDALLRSNRIARKVLREGVRDQKEFGKRVDELFTGSGDDDPAVRFEELVKNMSEDDAYKQLKSEGYTYGI